MINIASAARFLLGHIFRGRAHDVRSARFRFTVPNFPMARPVRYGIATLALICCGTM